MTVCCYAYVAKNNFMLSVIMLNAVMLCVVAPYPLTDIVFGATTFNLTGFFVPTFSIQCLYGECRLCECHVFYYYFKHKK
jgi:hypothetical protein